MKNINKKDIIIFVIIFMITCIIFMSFLSKHYATDTYNIQNKGYFNYAIDNSLNDGRIIMFIITFFAGIINISIDNYILILTILALFTSCIIVILLKNLILKYKKTKNKLTELVVIIISYFTIFNFMYLENIYFAECFVMSLSLLFYLLAAKVIVEGEKNYLLKAIILVILGVIAYQGTISMFFIALFVFSIIIRKNIKSILLDISKSIVVSVIAIIVNSIFIKIAGSIFAIEQTRGINFSKMIRNFYIIFIDGSLSKGAIIKTANIFPKYMYIIFLATIEFIVLFKSIKEKNKVVVLEQVLIIIACIVLSLVVSVININGFWSGRIRFSIGATIGFLFLHLYLKTDFLEQIEIYNVLLITTFIVYAIITINTYINCININVKVNELDKIQVEEINKYINEYEKNNNIEIKKICKINSNSEVPYYKSITDSWSVFSCSGIRTNWAIAGILNYYTNRKLEEYNINLAETEMRDIENDEKYICIGDTLYIEIYMY